MTLTTPRPHLTLTGLSTRWRAPLPSRLLGSSSCGASFMPTPSRCSPPVCLFPLFSYARGLGFITGFEEPDSALLPSSGSPWSSSIVTHNERENSKKIQKSEGIERESFHEHSHHTSAPTATRRARPERLALNSQHPIIPCGPKLDWQ